MTISEVRVEDRRIQVGRPRGSSVTAFQVSLIYTQDGLAVEKSTNIPVGQE